MDGNFGNCLKLFGLFVCKKPVCRTRSIACFLCSCLQRCNDQFLLYGTKDHLGICLKKNPAALTVNHHFFGISIYKLGLFFRVRIQYHHHKLWNHGRCCRHFRNLFNNFSFLLFYTRSLWRNCYFGNCDKFSWLNRRSSSSSNIQWRNSFSHWKSSNVIIDLRTACRLKFSCWRSGHYRTWKYMI